jgi:hypothetical protein
MNQRRKIIRDVVVALNDAGVMEITAEDCGKSRHMTRVVFKHGDQLKSVYFSRSGDWRAFKNTMARVRRALEDRDGRS